MAQLSWGLQSSPPWVLPIAPGDEWGHGIKGHFRDKTALHALSRGGCPHFSLLPFRKSLDLEPANSVSFCPRFTPCPFSMDIYASSFPNATLLPHPPPPSTLYTHTHPPELPCRGKPSCVSHTRGRKPACTWFSGHTPWWWTVSAREKEAFTKAPSCNHTWQPRGIICPESTPLSPLQD